MRIKMTIKYFFKVVMFAFCCILLSRCSSQSNDAPDLILVNGKVITVDSNDRIAEALAIKDGKIVAIGTSQTIEGLAGRFTKKIDLKHQTVTPGLIDAHIHFTTSKWSVPNMVDLSYPNVKSIEDVKKLIAQKVKELKPGEWIQGMGWDEGKLEEKRLITASDIDSVSPNNPVWLLQTMEHYGTANSKALTMANINAQTQNPPEGIIEKDGDGNPTGVLKESAMNKMYGLLPNPSSEDIERGMMHMTQALNKEGMTGIKDPILTNESWEIYKKMLSSGELSLRVFGLWLGGKSTQSMLRTIEKELAIPDSFKIGNGHLISGGIKLFADGSGGARTAWLYDQWNKNYSEVDTANYGFPNIQPDTLKEMIRMATKAGVHVSIHAIGDKTIDSVVTYYLQALKDTPVKGLRHGIIHSNIPTPYAVKAIKELQAKYDAGYPEPSATFMWWIGDTYAGNFGKRAERLDPFATFKKNGIIWGNGSDFSVTPFPARYAIWAAIARQPALGKYGDDPFGRQESVDVKTALKAVTIWAAHQMFLENKIGSIEVGKDADLAVWDRDLYTVPTDKIKDMKCLMTLFDGKVVYQSKNF